MKKMEIKIPSDATEILLTIKPEHASNIYEGIKKFELRKSSPRRIPRKIYLYETGEKGAITGHIIVEKVFIGSPAQILREISGKGIDANRFKKYYEGHNSACVYGIKHAIVYKNPINITTLKNEFKFVIPQHFSYVDGLSKLDRTLNDLSFNDIIKEESQSDIRFEALCPSNFDDFINLIHKHITKNYAETGVNYPRKLIQQYTEEIEVDSLTSRRRYILEIYKKDNLCGYIALTQKSTGSYKTAPFCLQEDYINMGIGQTVRSIIHSVVEKHGGRKVYCTAPTSNKSALNYLLSARYQIEAHLQNHYHQDHDDIVYGFDLSLAAEIDRRESRPKTVYTKVKFRTQLTPHILSYIKEDIFRKISGNAGEKYMERLIDNINSNKSSIIAYDDPTNIATIIEPKTNNTVRIYIHAQKFHPLLIKKLITTAELQAGNLYKALKTYFLIDVLDFELLPLVLEMGFRPEGIIKNYYYTGNDMMLISKLSNSSPQQPNLPIVQSN